MSKNAIVKPKRKSKGNREHLCKCGKSYLSYPALYTHIKKKHNGNIHQNAIREKKVQNNQQQKSPKDNGLMEKLLSYNKRLKSFLKGIGHCQLHKNSLQKSTFVLIEELPVQSFVSLNFIKDIVVCVEKLRVEMEDEFGESFLGEIETILQEIQNYEQLTCDYVMALFLIYLYRFSSKEFFQEATVVLVFMRETLNQKNMDQNSLDSDQQEIYSQINGAQDIPELANAFILEYFFKCIQSHLILVKDNLQIFGVEEAKLGRLVWFIKLFCDWLYVMKFSPVMLELPIDQLNFLINFFRLSFKINQKNQLNF